ncbi:pkinase-domain-containing protein [Mucor ambiguus]|uniref:Pkinase-domain-containing protein n=1 Tax=Mucor ambiguus TaxID=91626 RepID=A0A0C9LV09_9FUNG|nr:pkinase-domain-containing protein [Mucor ambiguus]
MSNSVIRNQKAKLAADYNDLLKELSSPKLKSIGCYTLGETIGRGSYGKVKLGVHQLTCRLVAIKKISKKHAPLMAREIHHHRQLHHPNIVSLYEILSTETSIFIVSEHCPHGDLFDALAKKGRFPEPHARRWFLQLIDAIQYCHSLGIIHRDLKLENILLDENNNVKICDFGFARQTDKNQLLKTFCGSLAYSAPEVIQRQNYSGPATDIWSLGVILYTLLAGELPFDDDSESELQRKVVKMDYFMPPYFSSEAANLIQKILKLNPYERYTIPKIRHHTWLQDSATTNSHILPLPSLSSQQQKLHEQYTADALLNAGFDTSVVKEMRFNHFGMLGTLWTMLLSKSNHAINVTSEKALLPKTTCTTQTRQKEDGWIDSFKSWLISKPESNDTGRYKSVQPTIAFTLDEKRFPGAVQQHKFMMKTMIAPPIITTTIPIVQQNHSNNSCTAREQKYPALKPTVLPLTPIHPSTPAKEEDELIINTYSTCSSAADDDYDDDDRMSVASSPATSVAEDENEEDEEDVQDKTISKAEFAEPNANCNMTAFHRVSPMPSRADILIPRSRYNIDERQNSLRNRLENRIIIEEAEEEEE